MRSDRLFTVRSRRAKLAALLVMAALMAACGGGAGTTASPTTSAATTAAASGGAFMPPNLKGATIRIAVGAAPDVSDTRVAQMAEILQSWGATSSVVNQTGDPAAIRVILAGQAEVGSIAVSTAINSGLMIFGPSQPRLDYHFIGASGLKTVQDLPGHVYGTSNIHGLEALMFADLLAKNNIKPESVTVTIAGGASVRVDAMLTHHIDATFVHFDSVKKLTSAGFNDLAKMSDATPELADSFMGASADWVKAHPDLATAVDEAWILSARVFNTDKKQWTDAAVKYAGGSAQDASDTYDGLLAANTFPVAKNVFASDSATAQENLASQVGAITSAPPLSTWFTQTAWDAASTALGVK